MKSRMCVAGGVAALLSLSIGMGAIESCFAAAVSPAQAEKIKTVLKERFPKIVIEQINTSPLPSLYEVVTPSEIAYTNEDGSLLFAGRVIDTRSQEDLTSARWSELHSIDFEKLPFDQAIKTVRGNGSRKLVVFSDPECPYCQKLERSIAGVTDVTIYTFLYPLEQLHPQARDRAVRIWCAPQRDVAYQQWMTQKVEPTAEACANDPVAANLALGDKLKINATPTLFVANGYRIDGAVSAEQLEKALSKVRVAKTN